MAAVSRSTGADRASIKCQSFRVDLDLNTDPKMKLNATLHGATRKATVRSLGHEEGSTERVPAS